ncbi:MAG: PaaI family thioesterase, partial [Candidatus Caldatribacteriaceae bacterium]
FRQEGEDTVTETVVPWYYQGFDGVVHGGMVAALLDEVMSHAVKATGEIAVTGTMEVKFLRPCRTGEFITLRGRVVEKKNRLLEAQGEIFQAGEVVAEGKGIFVIPREGVKRNV